MKYSVKFGGCGHEGTLSLVGKSDYREWRIKQAEDNGLCPECEEKARVARKAEQLAQSFADSKEFGFPELTGSEKQINWAVQLRLDFFEEAQGIKALRNVAERLIEEKTEAKFWIDVRDRMVFDVLQSFNEKFYEKDAAEETTVILEEDAVKSGIVTIDVSEGRQKITAEYVKDDEFRMIVKSVGFRWNSDSMVWYRNMTLRNGGVDRAVELAVKLLKRGFKVRVDKNLADKVKNSDYENECKRWIYDEAENICIKWEEADLYSEAKRIPGAKWNSGKMIVSPEFFREIRDFASMNSFMITKSADELLRKKENEESEKVRVEEKKKQTKEDKLKAILNSSTEVLDDLKD